MVQHREAQFYKQVYCNVQQSRTGALQGYAAMKERISLHNLCSTLLGLSVFCVSLKHPKQTGSNPLFYCT